MAMNDLWKLIGWLAIAGIAVFTSSMVMDKVKGAAKSHLP